MVDSSCRNCEPEMCGVYVLEKGKNRNFVMEEFSWGHLLPMTHIRIIDSCCTYLASLRYNTLIIFPLLQKVNIVYLNCLHVA